MISFALTACNEYIELERLLTQEVIDVINSFKNKFSLRQYNHISYSLNKDFATFKNNLKLHCTKEWIVYIDADEYLSEGLIDNIHELLNINKGIVDVIAVPRINTVIGLTREHIDKWKWFINEKGWINYPDYQTRICINRPEIQWINKVHERLSGWKTIANLPSGYDLIHPKTIEKQERQNNYYDTI